MLAKILYTTFKNMCFVTSYVGRKNVARLVTSYDTIIIAFVCWVSQINNAKYNWRVLSAKFTNGFHGYHSHHWKKLDTMKHLMLLPHWYWIQMCLELVANTISKVFTYNKVGHIMRILASQIEIERIFFYC
jgi:hypothetical protein